MKIKKILFFISFLADCLGSFAVEITGTRVFTVTPVATTGLEEVYVLEDASGATMSYTASSASAAAATKWYRFSRLGGGYAEPLQSSVAGTKTSVTVQAGDMGYIVESSGRQTAFWIVDYSKHFPTFSSFSYDADSDCDRVMFTPVGTFDRITYYSVNGAPIQLDRGIELEFYNLEYEQTDSVSGSWVQTQNIVDFADITGNFSVNAPLCNTSFSLNGDRFLREWGNPVTWQTDTYVTRHVDAKTWALQAERNNDNEQNNSSGGLGGSAPCDITFIAEPTDAVVFREWQFSLLEDFEDVLYRFNEDELTYTFEDYGNMYVRYVCADASGECVYEGEVYTVMIGESKLVCPNAFSPHNQDGVNDEWKVSYSSLISYDCHIFNRWGKQLFSSTNPAEGWDGKVGGKFVPSGVYFYVIKAEGSDGVKYNLSGDINIVGSKLKTNAGGSTAGEVE